MKGSLLKWLQLLTEEEWGDLAVWMRLSHVTRRTKAVSLFVHLNEVRHSEPLQTVFADEARIYEILYGSTEVVSQRVRRVMMELQQVVEHFMAARMDSPLMPDMDHEFRMLRLLLDRNQEELFLARWKRVQEEPLMQDALHPGHFLALLEMHRIHNEWVIHSRADEDSFESASAALDEYYLCAKMELFASMRTREKRYPQRHNYAHRDWVLAQVEDRPEQEGGIIRLWGWVLQMEESVKGGEAYESLRTALDALRDRMALPLLRQFRGYMFNYLSRTQRRGEVSYYEQLWQLLHDMYEEGTLHLKGRVSSPFFISAVRSACLCGQVKWARWFLQKERESLFDPEKATLLGYLDALVMLYEDRWREAWRLLLSIRFADVRMDCLVRVLQIQLAYEMRREEDFFRLCENFKQFIRHKEGLGDSFQRLYHAFGLAAEKLGMKEFQGKPLSRQSGMQIRQGELAEQLWLRQRV